MLTPHGTVLLVEDHPLYRQALLGVLRSMAMPEVLLAGSAEEGLRLLRNAPQVQLVLIDLGLPGMSGPEAIRLYRQVAPLVRVVVISATEDRRQIEAALRAGASLFLSKSLPEGALREALDRLLAGQPLPDRQGLLGGALPVAGQRNDALPSATASGMVAGDKESPSGVSAATDPAALLPLTHRQQETLALMARGYSNKEIALHLRIAEVTVKVHVSAIFRLLDVTNRTQAVLAARRLGLMEGIDSVSSR